MPGDSGNPGPGSGLECCPIFEFADRSLSVYARKGVPNRLFSVREDYETEFVRFVPAWRRRHALSQSSVTRRESLRLVLLRLAQLVPILLAVTMLCFWLLHLAGSDAVLQRMEATGTVMSQEAMDAARAELGLDRPLWEQYLSWLGGVLRGDMGQSYLSGQDVLSTFAGKLPATLLLAGVSIGMTVLLSVPLGMLAAVYRGKPVDWLLRAAGFVGGSMPNFFVALLLMDLFSIRLRLLPVISSRSGLQSVLLPALTLAIAMTARYLRQVRAAVLEELGKPYVAAAAARGIRFRVTLWCSVLRSALGTLVTLLALSLGSLLGGTAVVETIFLWDGVGKLAVDAINLRDYPLVMAYVLWMAVLYVGINLVTDLICPLWDPRIRPGGEVP